MLVGCIQEPHSTTPAVRCLQDLALLTMPQPEGNLQPGVEENIPGVIPVTNTITRHGGMMHPAKRGKRRIVVDMREFMSPLPCVLHQQTMDVVPVTLEVPSCPGTAAGGSGSDACNAAALPAASAVPHIHHLLGHTCQAHAGNQPVQLSLMLHV